MDERYRAYARWRKAEREGKKEVMEWPTGVVDASLITNTLDGENNDEFDLTIITRPDFTRLSWDGLHRESYIEILNDRLPELIRELQAMYYTYKESR